MSINTFNRRWARVIIEALTRHGVAHVCIAPGSRSTPLTLEAAGNTRLTCHTHFDERGLGHFALGIAKATGQTVAVIVTSGTAVANLHPAVIEAKLSGEKLVLLTADRPPELQDCDANQAIGQEQLFIQHAARVLALPRPTTDISARWLVSTIDDAMAQLTGGALHINCPFAEPLYGEMTDEHLGWSIALGDWWDSDQPWLAQPQAQMTPAVQPDWEDWRNKRGVVVAGRLRGEEGARVAAWAQQLGWPLLSDVLSETGQPLPYPNIWLVHPELCWEIAETEIVVQFGRHLTGRQLLRWRATCDPKEYWLIDKVPGRLDPAQHRGRRLVSEVIPWLEAHPAPKRIKNTAWCDRWQPIAARLVAVTKRAIDELLGDGLSEAQLAHRLPDLLPPDGQLFLGSSLFIRLVDALAQLPAQLPVWANRGASGIDGLVSTAAGVACANGKPLLAVLGDLSTLYDLNSLALWRTATTPMALIVVNNNGGGIFSLLPTPADLRERFYQMPHGLSFEHAAELFSLRYARPTTWAALQQAVAETWANRDVALIEVSVPPADGAELITDLVRNLQHQ